MALNEEQIGKVRLLLMSSGWTDVVKPLLAQRANLAIKSLILSPAEREGEYKDLEDSAIRQRIREIEWLVSALPNEVAVFDHNRRLDELERQSSAPTANP
jgi:hypothetical protein